MVAQDAPHCLDFSRRMVHGLWTMITHQFIKIYIHGTQEQTFSISNRQQVSDIQWEIISKIELIMIILNPLIALMLLFYGIHCIQSSKVTPCLFPGRATEAFMFHTLHGRYISQTISVEC